MNASGGKQPKKVPPSAQAAGPRKIPGLAIKRKAAPKSPEAPPTKKQRKEAEEGRQGAVDDQEEEELVYEEESAAESSRSQRARTLRLPPQGLRKAGQQGSGQSWR